MTADLKEKLEYVKYYSKLGWKVIILDGKRPITREWTRKPLEVAEIGKVLSKDPHLNIGVVTGKLSGIVAIDVDQPQIVGFNPESAMKKGALAHTTSKSHRLVFRSNNPEVLAFSKKITRKWTDLTEEEKEKVVDREKYEKAFEELKKQFEEGKITEKEFERKIPVITLIEILGDGRQFVAPPSLHPEKGVKFEWIAFSKSSEAILEVKNLDELKKVLWESIKNKEVLFELFEKEKLEETKKFPRDVLEEWLEIILKSGKLRIARDYGNYITFLCPFHPPDEHPSFTIYRNTFLAIDFHDGRTYTLKELANELGIQLPKGDVGVKGAITAQKRTFEETRHARERDILKIVLAELVYPTKHLPYFDDFRIFVGLRGDEYRPILKAHYYAVVSATNPRAYAKTGDVLVDLRVHVFTPLPSGKGKGELIAAEKEIMRKLKMKVGEPSSLHPEQLVGKVKVKERRKETI